MGGTRVGRGPTDLCGWSGWPQYSHCQGRYGGGGRKSRLWAGSVTGEWRRPPPKGGALAQKREGWFVPGWPEVRQSPTPVTRLRRCMCCDELWRSKGLVTIAILPPSLLPDPQRKGGPGRGGWVKKRKKIKYNKKLYVVSSSRRGSQGFVE